MCAKGGVTPHDIMHAEAMDLLAEHLTTALEIDPTSHALEAAYLIGEKPVTTQVVESIVPTPITKWEAMLIRNGYDLKDLAALLTAKPKESNYYYAVSWSPCERTSCARSSERRGCQYPTWVRRMKVSEEHKEDNKKETKR
jgi:hypothetical protein